MLWTRDSKSILSFCLPIKYKHEIGINSNSGRHRKPDSCKMLLPSSLIRVLMSPSSIGTSFMAQLSINIMGKVEVS